MNTDSTSDTTSTNEEVSWQVELAVKPGRLDDFRVLTHEMVEFTKAEEGVLVYERFISEDGKTVYVYERYANSAFAVAHLRAFVQMYGERFVDMVERKRFTVFGTPSEELKGMLDQFGAIYFGPMDGFSRI